MIKNFKEYLLIVESEASFKPLQKVDLLNLDQNQNKKIQSISSEEGFNITSFLNKNATLDMVVEAPGFKAGELFDAMRSWLFKYYEDPKKSEGRWEKEIKQGKIKGIFNVRVRVPGMLGSEAYSPLKIEYDLDFYFKDDKFRTVYSNLFIDNSGNSETLTSLRFFKPPYTPGPLSNPQKIEVVKKSLEDQNKTSNVLPSGEFIVKIGSRGDIVTAIQKILEVPETGVYDLATADAVKKFQKANNVFSHTPGTSIDGICNTETLSSIYRNTGVDDEKKEKWEYQQIEKELEIDSTSPKTQDPIQLTRKSENLVEIYKGSFNNGSALFLSIKDQMKGIKPGQVGGPEFDF